MLYDEFILTVTEATDEEIKELSSRFSDENRSLTTLPEGDYEFKTLIKESYQNNPYLSYVFVRDGQVYKISASCWNKTIYAADGTQLNTKTPLSKADAGSVYTVKPGKDGFRPVYLAGLAVRGEDFRHPTEGMCRGKRYNAFTVVKK